MSDTWTIIGAGPAGITAVGLLLDQGVSGKDILWIDPEFKVGDFGSRWAMVPSNTKVKFFHAYLKGCKAFQWDKNEIDYPLLNMDLEDTCNLEEVAKPLQQVTQSLLNQVNHEKALISELKYAEQEWTLISEDKKKFKAKNVVLAIGAEPITLSHQEPIYEIPLSDAMVYEDLKKHCDSKTKVAVFGSSHSAILAIKNLVNFGVAQIINFYLCPIRYALPLEDFILYDNTGLKGSTAQWARENIDGKLPQNLKRFYSNQENIDHYLTDCDAAIYAVGFQTRHKPFIHGIPDVKHDPRTSIIAPGLFGLGIAFPELVTNPLGIEETNVGLWKFMQYAKRVMPIWMRYR